MGSLEGAAREGADSPPLEGRMTDGVLLLDGGRVVEEDGDADEEERRKEGEHEQEERGLEREAKRMTEEKEDTAAVHQ